MILIDLGDVLPEQFVVIRTLYPGRDPNYGNLLQTWALRRVLLGLGQGSVVDSTPTSPTGARRFARLKNLVIRLSVMAPPGLAPQRWWRLQSLVEAAAPQRTFIDKYIPSVPLASKRGEVDVEVAARATAFVIGSDQVWRPRYADPASMLLKPLGTDDSKPRFSYAASFGRSDLGEWTPELIDQTRPLARRLDGISVRESSGVDVAKALWGVDAFQHVDPTLLLQAEEYAALASDAPSRASTGGLVDYVLDQGPSSLEAVAAVADTLGIEPTALMPRPASTYREFQEDPSKFRRPSVETWLATIASAGFIVTDSFHGTVFSILNNVPFLVLVNHERGAARFQSLLSMFGLIDRAVSPGVTWNRDLIRQPIDWVKVNSRIEYERLRSLQYIRDMLQLSSGQSNIRGPKSLAQLHNASGHDLRA